MLDDVGCTDIDTKHCLNGQYDVVLDKGTYDAICMNPDDAQIERRKYQQAVSRLVHSGGLFIITSCNWTQAELQQQFDTGNMIFSSFYQKQWHSGVLVRALLCWGLMIQIQVRAFDFRCTTNPTINCEGHLRSRESNAARPGASHISSLSAVDMQTYMP